MVNCNIRDWVDIYFVQRTVQDCASAVGFSKRERGELAIVASELASNILKYGVRGSIEVQAVEDAQGTGLSLVANDKGPPFRNLDAALKDGWDDQGPIDPVDMLKRKGIGGGLGAVVRLTHSFHVETLEVGKRIRVVRYLRGRRSRRPSRRPR
jgi:serine/threonine-protein kinase RsbT